MSVGWSCIRKCPPGTGLPYQESKHERGISPWCLRKRMRVHRSTAVWRIPERKVRRIDTSTTVAGAGNVRCKEGLKGSKDRKRFRVRSEILAHCLMRKLLYPVSLVPVDLCQRLAAISFLHEGL